MEKVFGQISGYSPVRFDRSRTIICYGMEAVDDTHATWYEAYYYKKQVPVPTLEMIKNDIINEINAQTDAKILNGFDYTIQRGADASKQVKAWLSAANQTDIERMAYSASTPYPVRHKVAEDDEGNAVYEEFENSEQMKELSDAFTLFIHQCQEEGWQKKDSIDWNEYIIPLENISE